MVVQAGTRVVATGRGAALRTLADRLFVPAPRTPVGLGRVALPMMAQGELPNSITMLRWLFMYTTFWALLWVPASRAGRVVAIAVVVVAAFTDNVVALYLPLAIARVWARRDAQGYASLGALLAGAGVNAAIVATGVSTHPSIAPRLDPVWATAAFAVRPVPQALLGEFWLGVRPTHDPAGLTPLVLAVACAVSFRMDSVRSHGPRWSNAVESARTVCHSPGVRRVDLPISPSELGWHAGCPAPTSGDAWSLSNVDRCQKRDSVPERRQD